MAVGTKSDPQPQVPESQQFNNADLMKAWEQFYKPMTSEDYINMNQAIMGQQIAYGPQIIDLQRQAQEALMRGGVQVQRQLFKPWFQTNKQLRGLIQKGMTQGYELGPELTKEVEQGIRAGQTARGNWLGPAPTAQEAMGKGQAALQMYNTRLAQGQQYLNSRQLPMDPYYPQQSYVDQGLGAQVFGQIGQQQSSYNSALGSTMSNYNSAQLEANNQNNNWMYQGYDRTADAWMYRESVRNGLYGMPSSGGGGMGGGGMGGMMGQIGGAVGTGMMGLAASGVIGAGATAAGVGVAGAAAGAAAAICWMARKLIPDQWKSFRKYLFTKATPEERRDYLYNARRLANALN